MLAAQNSARTVQNLVNKGREVLDKGLQLVKRDQKQARDAAKTGRNRVKGKEWEQKKKELHDYKGSRGMPPSKHLPFKQLKNAQNGDWEDE